jgi:hypothetical protein
MPRYLIITDWQLTEITDERATTLLAAVEPRGWTIGVKGATPEGEATYEVGAADTPYEAVLNALNDAGVPLARRQPGGVTLIIGPTSPYIDIPGHFPNKEGPQ